VLLSEEAVINWRRFFLRKGKKAKSLCLGGFS
jgi:hypothetical protein